MSTHTLTKPALWCAAFAATAIVSAAPANADPAQDYFNQLDAQGMQTWDYPGVLNQGAAICGMLYDNVNPYQWLLWNGYDPTEASILIMSAQNTLCPGNAVTGPPAVIY